MYLDMRLSPTRDDCLQSSPWIRYDLIHRKLPLWAVGADIRSANESSFVRVEFQFRTQKIFSSTEK
jgi:hypothetical protein